MNDRVSVRYVVDGRVVRDYPAFLDAVDGDLPPETVTTGFDPVIGMMVVRFTSPCPVCGAVRCQHNDHLFAPRERDLM